MQRYKYSFPTLASRIYFINCFVYSQFSFFLQILPFLAKHYALIMKFAGFFIWKNKSLRISRLTLMNNYTSGGLQLKNINLHSQALRLNRMLQIICNSTHVFSYAYLQTVLAHIDPIAPLDIQQWQHINPFFLDTYIELSYLLIAQQPIDHYTTRIIYQALYRRQNTHIPRVEIHNPSYDWPCIYGNIHSLRYYHHGHDIWYCLIHDNLVNKHRLHALGIVSDDLCHDCHTVDDIKHRITQCKSNSVIWRKYLRMMAILLHTSVSTLDYEHLIQFPEYKYFPPRKKKFMLWLTAQTLDIALQYLDHTEVECYISMLQQRLHSISPEKWQVYFDRFYTVMWM